MGKLKRLLDSNLIQSDRLRGLLPVPLKKALRRYLPYADYRSAQLRREAEARFGGPIPTESDYDSPYGVVLGIFFDNSYTYAFNVAACQELKVRFRVVNLTASDWVARICSSGCDAFLATPPTLLSIWHRMYEERLWVVERDLKMRLCPTFEELYLWESKRRMCDWLVANDVPHPETWVFYDREQAMAFCRTTRYPVVSKTNHGAASSGVLVLRDSRQAERLVNRAFGEGILPVSADSRDREWGSILFQEHIAHRYEWRIVRIGNHFMCRRKVRIGDFASGSGNIGWAAPPPGILDFAREVTDLGGFTTMSVDIFERTSGRNDAEFLVNELQAIVGAREVNLNEHAGRWSPEPTTGRWLFEPGFFSHNAFANLRVLLLLESLAYIVSHPVE